MLQFFLCHGIIALFYYHKYYNISIFLAICHLMWSLYVFYSYRKNNFPNHSMVAFIAVIEGIHWIYMYLPQKSCPINN